MSIVAVSNESRKFMAWPARPTCSLFLCQSPEVIQLKIMPVPAVVASSALLKECQIIPKKEQKWQFLPQIKNNLSYFCPSLNSQTYKIFSSLISSWVKTVISQLELVSSATGAQGHEVGKLKNGKSITSTPCNWHPCRILDAFEIDKEHFWFFKEPKEHVLLWTVL